MIGLGTALNVGGVLIGGFTGNLFKKGIEQRYRDTLMHALGACVIFLGIGGCLEEMLVVTEEGLKAQGTLLIICCFSIGAVIGEWLNIDHRVEQFGNWLKKAVRSEDDDGFVSAFVTTSITICVGSMSVIGAIADGISGDYSILATKAVIDGIFVLVMTTSMGKGCIFSAISLGVLQGAITILAQLIKPFMTAQALSNLSLTVSILIFCIGINMIWGEKIRVANLLPAIFLSMFCR